MEMVHNTKTKRLPTPTNHYNNKTTTTTLAAATTIIITEMRNGFPQMLVFHTLLFPLQRMVLAVREGDIDLLERLLERKNADMAMTWVWFICYYFPCDPRSF